MTQPVPQPPGPQGGQGTWRFLRRRASLIGLTTSLAIVGALALSLTADEQYSAEAQILVDEQSIDERVFPRRALPAGVQFQGGILGLASVDLITDQTSEALDLEPGSVSVERPETSNVITVEVVDSDPAVTAEFANALAANFIEFEQTGDRTALADAREQVVADLAALPEQRRLGDEGTVLRDQLSRITALRSLQTGNARVVEEAEVPVAPDLSAAATTARNVVLGGLLGLLAGIGLALLIDRSDPRLKDLDELKSAFRLPVLGSVPKSRLGSALTLTLDQLPAQEADAYRLLRSRLRFIDQGRVSSVLITSPSEADGKTTVGRYLAAASAEAGDRTLLVEADFHRPSLASRMEFDEAPGLAELLSSQAKIDEVIRGAKEPNLEVLVAGDVPPNPVALLESDRALAWFETLFESYEFVVIDTSPITLVADVFPLMRVVDGVVAVGRINGTRADLAHVLTDQLVELGATSLGVVATGVSGASNAAYYSEPSPPRRPLGRILNS